MFPLKKLARKGLITVAFRYPANSDGLTDAGNKSHSQHDIPYNGTIPFEIDAVLEVGIVRFLRNSDALRVLEQFLWYNYIANCFKLLALVIW